MRFLYKYPHNEFPYSKLVQENRRRDKHQPELELLDTGVFDEDRYFDVFVEYAKADVEDILIKITVTNRGPEAANLRVLPTIWFRNTWSWGSRAQRPKLHEVRPALNPLITIRCKVFPPWLRLRDQSCQGCLPAASETTLPDPVLRRLIEVRSRGDSRHGWCSGTADPGNPRG